MGEHTTQTEARIETGPLAKRVVFGFCATAAFVLAASALVSVEAVIGAGLGAAVVLLATVAGLALMKVIGARPAQNWGFVYIAVSSLRNLVAVGLGVGVYIAREPAAGPYWAALLALTLGVLAVEAAAIIKSVRSVSPRVRETAGVRAGRECIQP